MVASCQLQEQHQQQNVVCLRLIQQVLWVLGSSFLYAVFIDHLSMFASASCIIKLLHNISGFSLAGWPVDFTTGDKLLAVIEMCNNLSSNLIVALLRFGTRATQSTYTRRNIRSTFWEINQGWISENSSLIKLGLYGKYSV